jgi:hypothetical protein
MIETQIPLERETIWKYPNNQNLYYHKIFTLIEPGDSTPRALRAVQEYQYA